MTARQVLSTKLSSYSPIINHTSPPGNSCNCHSKKKYKTTCHLLLNSNNHTQMTSNMLIHQISTILIVSITSYSLMTSWANGQHAHGDPNAPREYLQHNNILKFSVEENKPNNTLVGIIRSADDQVPYLVLPSTQTPERELKQAFNVNFTTGELTTNSLLDREHRDQYHFIAIVREPFAEIKCTIEITDVNDNAPKFLMPNPNETSIVIDMLEGQRGIRQVLPLAFDFDSPQYGIKEFRIISGNTPSGTFQLVEHEAPARSTLNQNGNLNSMMDDMGPSMLAIDNPQLKKQLDQEATVLIPSQPSQQLSGAIQSQSATTTTRSFLVDLEASHALDRENQSSYQLVVEAIDGGQPPQFGRLVVTVNVQDVNDNDPIFLKKFYECQVSEDSQKGTLVEQVQAIDADLDSNGLVSYYIKRHVSSSQQLTNSTTSSDYNNNGLDLVANRYANSNNNNNNKPRIQSTQTLGKPSVRGGPSLDNQENSSFKTRSSFASDQLFEIDSKDGKIRLVNQLDFETDQRHELIIEARDHGKPSRSSQTTLIVHVLDAHDDPPMVMKQYDDKKHTISASGNNLASSVGGENGLSEPSARLSGLIEPQSPPFGFNSLSFASGWFSQMNSSILFVIVLVALLAVTFPVCLVKIKSRQPESDYNDTAGLTLPSNNGQTKPSPSHSASNIEHPNGMMNDNIHHHHHMEHQRRAPNLGPGAGGSFGGHIGIGGKNSRYQFTDSSSNHYHNPYPQQQRPRHHSTNSHHHLLAESPSGHHQLSSGMQGSRGGTMTLSHHHHHLLNHTPPVHHDSIDHHQHQFASANLATGSLTYAHHSHAALLHQAHHHQSSHQLSPVHHQIHQLNSSHMNKGGTMNSIGTHHSAHHPPSDSPMPATPNTIHSSVIQPTSMHHDPSGHHVHRNLLPSIPSQSGQLPPTPTHQLNSSSVFPWPPHQGPGSTLGCYPDGHIGSLHDTPGSTMDSCSSPRAGGAATPPQPLDRWFEVGATPQLINAQDWCGSYNWDYLEDWTPEYHNLMPIIQAEAAVY